jgi:hypothetical protein
LITVSSLEFYFGLARYRASKASAGTRSKANPAGKLMLASTAAQRLAHIVTSAKAAIQ